MTAAPPAYRRCSPAAPAPEAVRCPTPGCFRRRNLLSRGRGLTALCHRCRNAAPRPAGRPKPPKPRRSASAPGVALVLTRGVPAAVWSVAAARDGSTVPPERRTVPAGTRVVAVGALSKCDGGGDPVVELACGGRFVCRPDAMRLTPENLP